MLTLRERGGLCWPLPWEGGLRIQPRDKNAFTLIAHQPAPYALQLAPNAPAKNKAPHFLRQPHHSLQRREDCWWRALQGELFPPLRCHRVWSRSARWRWKDSLTHFDVESPKWLLRHCCITRIFSDDKGLWRICSRMLTKGWWWQSHVETVFSEWRTWRSAREVCSRILFHPFHFFP